MPRIASRRIPGKVLLLLLAVCAAVGFTPVSAPAEEAGAAGNPAVMTFEEYLERGGEEWFLTGKKEYGLQAMMVSKETSFRNDLEVTDYTVNDDGITVILKGSFGEMWTSKMPKVQAAYRKPDGSELTAEDFAQKDVFIDIITSPEPDAYYAMHVPAGISVTVRTAWGDILHTNLPNAPHGGGDYLLCRTGENGRPDLSDVWVLNGVVFPEYYDTSRMPQEAEADAA